jgi:hypothetical protein
MTRYTPQWLQAGSYAASGDRRLIGALWPAAACSGCAVSVGSGMTVNVAAGQVSVPTQNATGSTLCTSDAVEQVTLASALGSGVNRYDLIICQPRGNDLDGGSNTDFIFTSVTGAGAGSPTVPPTPAGAVALAQIFVPGASVSVVAGNITDIRPGNLAIPVPPFYTLPPSTPRGFLGVTRYTATSGAVGATLTPIPGANVTVTVAAGRRIKVTGTFSLVASAVATLTAAISEGPTTWTTLGQALTNSPGASSWNWMAVTTVLDNPTAGTHTYGLSIAATAGTVTMQSNGQQPSITLVEDIGAYP